MGEPFTPKRVAGFLVLCLLGLLAVWAVFMLLIHARARQSITPGNNQSLSVPLASSPDYASRLSALSSAS